ncbi:hypothetical protein HDU97_009555 [Phlyctochytrium planicorne]|nr:hypothetical protein HDU97_009555 [Phlyctochytrium planicorne]
MVTFSENAIKADNKRKGLSRAVLHEKSDKPDEAFLYVEHLNLELKRLNSDHHLDTRLHACSELAHVLYHGGPLDEYLPKNQLLFEIMFRILQSPDEPFALRLQCIQTFGILCRGSPEIQQVLLDRGAVDLLLKLMIEGYEDMRKWACHGLLFLMVNHHKRYLPQLKTVSVQIYLEYLPSLETDAWPLILQKERQGYEDLKKRFVFDPSRGGPKNLEVNNPLSLAEESPWSQYFKDTELEKIIRQDVERTMPDQPFFRQEQVQDVLTNILFVWSKLNPDVSYRQGMHEILAPVLYVVDKDKCTSLQTSVDDKLFSVIFDEKYVEHDTAVLFYRIMRAAKPFYETGNDVEGKPIITRHGKSSGQSRVLPIVTHCKKIQNDLLRVLDSELCDHLNSLGIEPQLYGLRWLRLLFGREFALDEVLTLWDGLFADDPNLGLVDWVCVALLVFMRRDLLNGDFSVALHRLMKFPPMQTLNTNIPEFISSAKGCRDRYGQIALAAAKNVQLNDSDPLVRTPAPRQQSSSSLNSVSSTGNSNNNLNVSYTVEQIGRSPTMAEASSDPYAAKVALLESRVASQWRESLKAKDRDKILNKKVESSLTIMRDLLAALQEHSSLDISHAPEFEGVIAELNAVAAELSSREKLTTGWTNTASAKPVEAPKPSVSNVIGDPLSDPSPNAPPSSDIPTSPIYAAKASAQARAQAQRTRSDLDRAAAASLFNSTTSPQPPKNAPAIPIPDVDNMVRAATGSMKKMFSDLSTTLISATTTANQQFSSISPSSNPLTRPPTSQNDEYREQAGLGNRAKRMFPPPPPTTTTSSSTFDPLSES